MGMIRELRKLKNMFQDPPKEYRPAPFYFLNHRLERDEVLRQIREMDAKGVGGVVLHARHGLLTPYMSEDWFDILDVAVQECDKLGMVVWLYDEDNWPSGTYGGRLTREHPEYRMRYLRVQEISIERETAKVQVEKDDNTLISAYACKFDEGTRVIASHLDVTDAIGNNGEVDFSKIPQNHDILLIFWECPVAAKVTYANGYYLDTMNQEAVQAFIKLAYEPYERFSKYFGNTIQGVFTDEPGLMIHDGFFGTEAMRTSVEDLSKNLPGHVFAWTRDFFHKFEALMGYDLRERLPALLYETKCNASQIREDYYEAITTWYVTNYHKAIGDWCRSRGLKYIGHTLEDPLWGQARSQGNQTRVLQQFDYPGLDYLNAGVGTKDDPYRILAAKCASSVACVEGKSRVMCEAFGGSGHGHTLGARKLDANFMAVLGVNLYIPHAFYYSFAGFRKTDWPPTEFYHAPFWPYYKPFADYLGRLSVIANSGEHVAHIAVLSPIHTAYQDMFKDGNSIKQLDCDRIYAFVSDRLLRYHRDYHYLDEVQLRAASVDKGKLFAGVRKEGYEVLILPGAKMISSQTAMLIRDFVSSGGTVIVIGALPKVVNWETTENDKFRKDLASSANVVVLPFDDRIEDAFYEIVTKVTSPQLDIRYEDGKEAEDIIVSERKVGDTSIYLLVNRRQEASRVQASFCSDYLCEWDLDYGVVSRVDKNGGILTLDFAPAEARVFSTCSGEMDCSGVCSDETGCSNVLRGSSVTEICHCLDLTDNDWSFRALQGNVLPLDTWNVKMDARPMIPGQVNVWSTTFEVRDVPQSLKLVLDTPDQWIPSHVGFLMRQRATEVFVNGERLPALRSSSWQDRYYLEQNIAEYVKSGVNEIRIETVSLLNPMHGVGHPAYLVGEFSLSDSVICGSTEKFFGYWTEHGYPYFSGIGRYETQFPLDIKSADYRYWLKVESVSDGMAVRLNGKLVDVRLWPPFEVDITDFLVDGKNTLQVEVFNSLENLYNRNPRESGLSGSVSIEAVKLGG